MGRQLRVCPHCGRETYGLNYCGKCGQDMTSPPIPVSNEPIAVEQRRAILQKEIQRYVGQGFRVLSQTDTTAQLVKPKTFSFLAAIIGVVVLYLLYYLSKRDELVYVTVDEYGRVSTRRVS